MFCALKGLDSIAQGQRSATLGEKRSPLHSSPERGIYNMLFPEVNNIRVFAIRTRLSGITGLKPGFDSQRQALALPTSFGIPAL
jgi:hypothetical protein